MYNPRHAINANNVMARVWAICGAFYRLKDGWMQVWDHEKGWIAVV